MFAKNSILAVWQGSEYTSEYTSEHLLFYYYTSSASISLNYLEHLQVAVFFWPSFKVYVWSLTKKRNLLLYILSLLK